MSFKTHALSKAEMKNLFSQGYLKPDSPIEDLPFCGPHFATVMTENKIETIQDLVCDLSKRSTDRLTSKMKRLLRNPRAGKKRKGFVIAECNIRLWNTIVSLLEYVKTDAKLVFKGTIPERITT
jgi:hypothetical protein